MVAKAAREAREEWLAAAALILIAIQSINSAINHAAIKEEIAKGGKEKSGYSFMSSRLTV